MTDFDPLEPKRPWCYATSDTQVWHYYDPYPWQWFALVEFELGTRAALALVPPDERYR